MSRAIVLAALALGSASAVRAEAQPAGPDRYGPAAAPAYGAGGPTQGAGPIPAMRGRVLSWPGKTAALAPPPASTPAVAERAYALPVAAAARSGYAPSIARPVYRGYAPAAYLAPGAPSRGYAASGDTAARERPPQAMVRYAGVRPDAAVSASPQPSAAPAADGWRPVFAAPAPPLAGAPRPAALPTSIYSGSPMSARAAAAPPPIRSASAERRYGYDMRQDHSVRFYSVHRPFGLQPDPAPIPPQFFTATADLSQPPGPLPSERTTTTSSGGTAHTVRAAPDTSAQ